MRTFGVAGVLAALALLAGAPAATACSCVAKKPKELLRQADGAAVARLLAIRSVDDGGDFGPADFVYRTGKVLKGKSRLRRGRRLVIRSTRSGASCGLSGRPGRLTGLFLYRSDGQWTSSLCTQIGAGQMRRLGRKRARESTGGGCT